MINILNDNQNVQGKGAKQLTKKEENRSLRLKTNLTNHLPLPQTNIFF